MSKTEKAKRYVIFIIGLFINSVGVSLITKADLGTSPISSIPYVLSLNFSFTLGEYTIFFSLLLILLQLIILRKEFKVEHFLQIPFSIVFGYFIDISMGWLSFMQPNAYLVKVISLLIGCVVLGIGVYCEMLANVVMLPGESFVRAICFRTKKEFGTLKVTFDCSMTIIAVALSFIFSGRLNGVREGTIIAAVLVGFIARFIDRNFSFLHILVGEDISGKVKTEDTGVQEQPICIVIGRQFGSGGHELGKMLAEKLSYKFYDEDIIQMAAGSTGYAPDYISERDEKMTNSLIYDLVSQMYAYSNEYATPDDAIFKAESDVVKELAAKGNCVIVGRCADFILRNYPKCLKVYFFAPMKYKIERIIKKENLSQKEAEKKIQQTDKKRAEHYRYYTHRIWGMASNYDVCINTSFGEQHVENMIMEMLKVIE